MLQKEHLDKLQKVDRDRIIEVWRVIEEVGIKFPNKVLSVLFKKNKGEVSTYLNGKKPLPDDCYKTFIQQYKKPVQTDNKELPPVGNVTTEKESELQALLSITQVYAESHLGLVRSHEILNQNHTTALAQNEELIKLVGKDKGQKFNLNSAPNGLQVTETFSRLLSEFLANKYSLNQSEIRKDVGRILLSFQDSTKSSDIQKNEKNEGS